MFAGEREAQGPVGMYLLEHVCTHTCIFSYTYAYTCMYIQASLLIFGSYLVFAGEMEAQGLLAFMLYQGQLQEYFANLLNSFTNLIKSAGAGMHVHIWVYVCMYVCVCVGECAHVFINCVPMYDVSMYVCCIKGSCRSILRIC